MFIPIKVADESDIEKDKSANSKRSWLVEAGISFKLVTWASLDYIYRAERDYALSDKVQRSSSMLFSLNYFLGDKEDEEDKKRK